MNAARVFVAAAILLASRDAWAGGRYQLLGMSDTHLVVRHVHSRSECCGADPVVDCKYEGIAGIAKGLDAIRNPFEPKLAEVPRSYGGVTLIVFPYRHAALTQVPSKEEGGARLFPIYESVIDKAACTTAAAAKKQLAAAKAHAKSVGIDLDAGAFVGAPTGSAKQVRPADCLPEKSKPECTSGESGSEYFVRGDTSEGSQLHVFVKTGEKQWAEIDQFVNAALWLAPPMEYPGATQFRLFASAMGETNELAWFLVP